MGPIPQRASEAEEALVGARPTPDAFRAAAEACTRLDATDDVHAPATYRQHLAGVLVRRALVAAHERVAQL